MPDGLLPLPAIFPRGVKAAVSTRHGGVSRGAFESLNLGDHVGDAPASVLENRARFKKMSGLLEEPCWLNQVHGSRVVYADHSLPEADASWSDRPGRACVVMTADCLPILLWDRQGRCVAAVHGGWRSLNAGLLAKTIAALPVEAVSLSAWLGPAIGPDHFEVGPEVMEAFVQQDRALAECFQPGRQSSQGQHFMADLYRLAGHLLRQAGVLQVYGGGYCTVCDERFFSYRRDHQTGRFASAIWLS